MTQAGGASHAIFLTPGQNGRLRGERLKTPRPSGTILIARRHIIGGLDGMGAKYLPTIKDRKASQRFQQKQNPLHKFKKSAANQPAGKGKKK